MPSASRTTAHRAVVLVSVLLLLLLSSSSLPSRSSSVSALNLTEQAVLYVRSNRGHQHSRFHFHADGTVLPVGSFRPHNASASPLQARRRAVRDAVKHAWDAYVASAWGYDELQPVSRQGKDTFAPGLGTTIVDSLSTLFLLGEADGLDGRYQKARDWVAYSLDFSKVGRVIVFETVIRILGGLLSMFHLSGDRMYLHKAEELGARLAAGFDTPQGLPWPRCFLNEIGRCERNTQVGDSLYLAELGSIQLEFRALAHHSQQPLLKYMRNVTELILDHFETAESTVMRLNGSNRALYPFTMSLSSGKWTTNLVTLGAPADSYFEYLVKLWVQSGRRETVYWERFARVMDGLLDIATYTSRNGVTIVRDVVPSPDGQVRFQHRMDHFSCYIPGMIVLGIDGLPKDDVERRRKWEVLAEQLTETCFQMYERSPSGLSGELIRLNHVDHWTMSGGYQLRPEAVEAFFYMYRYTKKEKYRDYAWHVFQHLERHCRVDSGGYSSLRTARSTHPVKGDVMHSFLISETFKYLYLIFGDDPSELPLDKWVFNTEAHPLLVTPDISRPQRNEGSRQSSFSSDQGQDEL